ncbi:MAG TPA: transglutaminase family protein [Gemmataceae bacterium]|nr:transglutaminase family protein [Gemmataceae bacterium]
MLIRIGYELTFQAPARTPMLLMLYTHPSRAASLRQPDHVQVEPYAPVQEFIDALGNRGGRLVASPGKLRLWNATVIEDGGEPDAVCPYAAQQPVEELPPEMLTWLLGSRYCEVGKLTDVAWSLFGQTPLGWPRVQAVCDWVHRNVQFGYQFASPTRSALDVFRERTGVCRDLNHLALTFCRCLGVPARYVTGYLGDIGVPWSPAPMDFSGWFEAYLGGRWHTFDARHNTPRVGRVVMARGRDAVDVAFTTSFGPMTLETFTVNTDVHPQSAAAAMR